MSKTIENFDSHIIGTYGRLPLVMEKAENSSVISEDNIGYIDFGSGIGVNSLGFCDENWTKAVCSQVNSLQHTSNYYYTKIQSDLAEKLCEVTGYSKMFFGNSGAEANECAIKLARKYSFDKYGKGRHKIITLENSFHGRTLTTLSATGQEAMHNYFFPFVDGFVYVKANDIDDLKSKLDDTVCAVMFEFIQGEGGVVPLKQDFVDAIFEECSKKDVLTIGDEVQTGVSRTGTFLAFEQYKVKPDITTLAKGLGGGLPVGVCLANKKCENVLTPGTHGSTFGGNPVCCAGCMAVLEKVAQDEFYSEVNRKADYLRKKLSEIKAVKQIDGLGLMIGIVFEKDNLKAADVLKLAFEKGLLILTAKEKIRLLPPLTISYSEIDKGIEILKQIL